MNTSNGFQPVPSARHGMPSTSDIRDFHSGAVPDYPRAACVHQLFEAQVERIPEAVAAEFEQATLTYAELNRRANRLAHHLQQLGVGPDVLVGLYVERSLDMLTGLLAILKVGGAYVPLDPNYPAARVGFMLDDAALSVLVTQQSLAASIPAPGAHLVCLDNTEAFSQYPDTNPVSASSADSLAYVIYTSGSTGQPKGVQIPHRALVNFLYSMRQTPGLSAHDAVLAVTTLSFDIAALEIFLPLISGARTVLVSRDTATDGRQLIAHLNRGITVLQATPATWRMLIDSGWQGTSGLKMLCGGEAMSRDLADQLLQRGDQLWNLYGPTETTVWSTLQRVTAGPGPIPIGMPIANTQVYVLDAQGQPVPPGEAGELHIGGDGLARGYLKRPVLTTEKFIRNPFSHEPQARLYKTGDLARHLPDGTLDCLGRIDHQVKIRGYRIELGEIETLLKTHSAVRDSVVIARADTPGEKRLVAYVIPHAESPLPIGQELRSFLKQHLPEYMVPAAYVTLDVLPLTPNGKIDRRALPTPEVTGLASATNFVPPRTSVEMAVASFWAGVLKREQIGIHDNFFGLGGHSLLATRVMAQVREAFRVELPAPAQPVRRPERQALREALKC